MSRSPSRTSSTSCGASGPSDNDLADGAPRRQGFEGTRYVAVEWHLFADERLDGAGAGQADEVGVDLPGKGRLLAPGQAPVDADHRVVLDEDVVGGGLGERAAGGARYGQ